MSVGSFPGPGPEGDPLLATGDPAIVVGYPSDDFPAPPAFRFACPQGWRAVASVDADAVVIGPEAVAGIHPNVVIDTHRVPPTDDPGLLLRQLAQRQMGAAIPSAEGEPAEGDQGRDSRSYAVRFIRLVHPDAPGAGPATEVAQLLHLHYIPGPRIAHVLVATGTWAPASPASGAVVEAVIGSIRR